MLTAPLISPDVLQPRGPGGAPSLVGTAMQHYVVVRQAPAGVGTAAGGSGSSPAGSSWDKLGRMFGKAPVATEASRLAALGLPVRGSPEWKSCVAGTAELLGSRETVTFAHGSTVTTTTVNQLLAATQASVFATEAQGWRWESNMGIVRFLPYLMDNNGWRV